MALAARLASRSMCVTSINKTARSYSSTPLRSAVGTLFTACKRVTDNSDQLSKFEKQLQLFPSNLNPASLWWTMVQLHMPAQTQIEIVEFLGGVKMAAKLQLKAVNSKEFAEFAEFAAGLTSESKVADELSDYCTPRFFDNLKNAASTTLKDREMTLELQDITIESAEVTEVRYAQLTKTEYDAQTAGLVVLPFLWAADATIEYMQIRVRTKSLETTKMTLTGQEECLVLQDNTRTWIFGSKVGSADELE